MDPVPEVYPAWWAMAEQCSGLAGDFSSVEWYTVPRFEEDVAGAYYPWRHDIAIRQGRELDGSVVRHEMVHALVKGGGHPRHLFVERCADIVACPYSCLDDAGGPIDRDPNALRVGTEAFRVTIELFPMVAPRHACTSVVVSAESKEARAVTVSTPRTSSGGFGWVAEGIGGSDALPADTVMEFRPREVRRHVFDCSPLLEQTAPGSYEIRGFFNTSASEPVTWSVIE